MKAYVINWYGPYSDETLWENKFKNCLYLITGKMKYDKVESILYCGITTRTVFQRVYDQNHKSWSIYNNINYWVGFIEYSRKPPISLLRKLEHIIIYFWETELNEQNKEKLPKEKLVLINHWKKPNGEFRKKRVYEAQYLDDFIYFNGKNWFKAQNIKEE